MKAQFRVTGRVNGADGASLTIDRERGIASVRPKRERRVYVVTLQTLAEMVVSRVVKDEMARKGAA